jgi:hypothetical protein
MNPINTPGEPSGGVLANIAGTAASPSFSAWPLSPSWRQNGVS